MDDVFAKCVTEILHKSFHIDFELSGKYCSTYSLPIPSPIMPSVVPSAFFQRGCCFWNTTEYFLELERRIGEIITQVWGCGTYVFPQIKVFLFTV